MWASYDEKDEYNRRAKEERDQFNREAAERGIKKEKKPHAQSRLKTRCSPIKISEIMKIIEDNEDKRRAVEEMGFGALKNVPNVKLAHKLIEKLLDRFDTGSCSLFGVKVNVEDVGNLLGIPSRGTSIPESISTTKNAELGAKFKDKTLGQLGDEIKIIERIDDTFKETFMLYVLGHFLCPNVKDRPTQELYKALAIVSDAPRYNWAKFVLDHLVEGIKKYKKGSNNSTTGCIYLLMVRLVTFCNYL